MLVNGKADKITGEDFRAAAEKAGIKKAEAENCMAQVRNAVLKWRNFAETAELSPQNAKRIESFLKAKQ